MPAEFWYPISSAEHNLPASSDQWTLGAGANKNVAMQPGGGRAGPMTHDDATTYISGSDPLTQSFNADWPGPIAVFNSISIAIRTKANFANPSMQARFRNAAGTDGSAVINYLHVDANWITNGPTDGTSAKPGGGAWGPSDFADDQTYFPTLLQVSAVSTPTYVGTSIWGVLDYNPPSGGFAFLLGIAGLLPVLGPLTDFAHFARYLAWRRACHPRHTLLAGDEVERAWREIRAYRHPTFFLPRFA